MSQTSPRPAPLIVNPFDASGSWLKGCLHLHTTASDGALTPEETLRRYRALDYDFIGITDHEAVIVPQTVPEGLIWIPAVEYATTSAEPPEHWHVVSVGTEKQLALAGYPVKSILKLLTEVSPFVFVAHPYWSNQGGDDLLALPTFNAIEIYNHMADTWLDRGHGEYFWDYMLSAGRRIWAVAGDDTHRPEHIGGGRVKVRVQERSAEAIVNALRTGMFYATTGPDFLDIRVDETGVSVKTSPVRSISFVADNGRGQFLEAEPGDTLENARYTFAGSEIYLRIQCADPDGKKAWSNSRLFLEPTRTGSGRSKPVNPQPESTSIGPFAAPGNWYRGALHVHTSNSDGRQSPQDVLNRYQQAGFHFVVLTDHNRVTRLDAPQGLLLLPGIELGCVTDSPRKNWHVVGVGCEKEPKNQLTEIRDIVTFLKSNAQFVVACHPYWSNLSGEDLRSMSRCDAVEVFNTVCQLIDRGHAEQPWDYVLSAGEHLNAVATDDSHQKPDDLARAWVMIKAPELSPAAVYRALKDGHFYSSTGPQIHDWTRAGGGFRACASDCRTISFMSNTWYGGRFDAQPDTPLNEAAYELQGPEIYLRVQVTDAEGKRAWTNPIYF